MSLQGIVAVQKEKCWLRNVRALTGAVPGYVLTEKEAGQVVGHVDAAISSESEVGILNWTALGLTRSVHFLEQARHKGVFRLGARDYQSKAEV